VWLAEGRPKALQALVGLPEHSFRRICPRALLTCTFGTTHHHKAQLTCRSWHCTQLPLSHRYEGGQGALYTAAARGMGRQSS